MSKIVCDICGTTFNDTEDQCPICGCAKDMSTGADTVKLMEEEITAAAVNTVTAKAAKPVKAPKAPIFDEDDFDEDDEEYDDEYDEEDYDEDYDDDEDYDEDDDDEDDEDEHKSNAPLIVALVLVILVLIALGAFILVKYFLPNMGGKQPTVPEIVETTEAPVVETTELKIPCESLALTSGGEIVLEEVGANWLINVMALPENTTDELVYASSDESVVIVNAQGKLTAMAEGTAVITITCGGQELKCTVTCDFTEETTAPTEPEETTAPSEPEDGTEPSEPEETTEPTEATKPTEPLKNVDLEKAISHKDLTFNGKNQGFTFKINGLKNTEVKWSSEDENVVTVDEKGFVTSIGKGNTYIVCKYGDQEVRIKITCKW